MSFQRNSVMRQAFEDAKVRVTNDNARMVDKIVLAFHRKVGMIRERDWNYIGSKKTIESVNEYTGLNLKPSFN